MANYETYTVARGDDDQKNRALMESIVGLPRKKRDSEGESSESSSDSGTDSMAEALLEDDDPEVMNMERTVLQK